MVAKAAVFLSRTWVDYVATQINTLSANTDHLINKLKKTQHDLHMLKCKMSAVDLLVEDQAVVDLPLGQGSQPSNTTQWAERVTKKDTQIFNKKSVDMKQRVQTMSWQELLENLMVA